MEFSRTINCRKDIAGAVLSLCVCIGLGCKNKPALDTGADAQQEEPAANLKPEKPSEIFQETPNSTVALVDAELPNSETASIAENKTAEKMSLSPDGDDDGSLTAKVPSGTWTTQRLIALAAGGPAIVDFSVNVGDKSLEEASAALSAAITDEVFADLQQPIAWVDLLKHPLVASGWLGNLIAEDEQVDQLIGMYDTERDDIVTAEEFGLFLSRGLARNKPLQISDVGSAPNADPSRSPWGEADQNRDFILDQGELEQLHSRVVRYDYNGDATVTRQELRQSRDMQTQRDSMSRRSLLATKTLVVTDVIESEEVDRSNRAIRSTTRRVQEHYTFLDGVPRESWHRWSAERWQLIDLDDDGLVGRDELRMLLTIQPDASVMVRFPAAEEDAEKAAEKNKQTVGIWSVEMAHSEQYDWQVNKGGGQLALGGCLVRFELSDGFSAGARTALRRRLQSGLRNEQLQSLLVNQLQLNDGAFDLIDPDGDKELSDEEFSRVWQWLRARQATRVVLQWMVAEEPWFQLLDISGDGQLTAKEMIEAVVQLTTLDANADQKLTPNELPLVIRLSVARSDNRLGGLPTGTPATAEEGDEDWFAAMDTNRDGYIDPPEFLGERDEFSRMDTNKDGFLVRSEVYASIDRD